MSTQKRAKQSFLIQYLSLILIILSILVTAVRPNPAEKKLPEQPVTEDVMASLDPNFLSSEILLDNVFSDNGLSINAESFDSIWELLANHNIDLQLEVVAKDQVGTKVFRLSRLLREKGFWKDSFSVSGKASLTDSKPVVTARFKWSKR